MAAAVLREQLGDWEITEVDLDPPGQGELLIRMAAKDIPAMLDLYRQGRLKLDELITTRYSLSEINKGYADMRNGRNIRGVIVFD